MWNDGLRHGKEQDEATYEPMMFLGKDIKKIPCFRTSLLAGIVSGLFVGLGYIFATGKGLVGYKYAMYTFTGVTLGIWIPCRWDHSKKKILVAQATKMATEYSLARGTEKDPRRSNHESSTEEN